MQKNIGKRINKFLYMKRSSLREREREREGEREGKYGDRILILIMVKAKCATVLLRFVSRIVANNMVILIIQFVS